MELETQLKPKAISRIGIALPRRGNGWVVRVFRGRASKAEEYRVSSRWQAVALLELARLVKRLAGEMRRGR